MDKYVRRALDAAFEQQLKPGLYVQVGDSIKSIDAYDGALVDLLRGGTERNPSVEMLAGQVAWVFVALDRRREQLLEIPHQWMSGGDEAETAPFDMPFKSLIQQVDTSMQLYSTAYLLKQRGGNEGMMGVRWLDPQSIEPDYDTATAEDGVTRYFRNTDAGQRIAIPADDLLVFMIPGMRELRPAVSPLGASRLAASILRGIDQTADVFYENNGLPIMMVEVPAAADMDRQQNLWRRIFNARRGTQSIRTVAVRPETKVTPLSFAPKDLDQTPLTGHQIDTILAAHKVPKSIALSNSANYATAIADIRGFVGTMGGRFEYMAEVFNTDADFMATGYELDVRTQDHYAMKEDEAQRAGAFLNYVQGGTTRDQAFFMVGINPEEFPDWVDEGDDIADETGTATSNEIVTQEKVLNGAQIASAISIVEQYSKGLYPRRIAINMIQVFFNIPRNVAELLVPTEDETEAPEAPTMGGELDDITQVEDDTPPADLDAKALELAKLRRYISNGNHHKRAFTSDVLTPEEIQEVVDNQDAPFPGWQGYP